MERRVHVSLETVMETRRFFVCSDIITLPSVSSRSLEEGLGQSKGRVTEVIFIECCVYTIFFGLTRLRIL